MEIRFRRRESSVSRLGPRRISMHNAKTRVAGRGVPCGTYEDRGSPQCDKVRCEIRLGRLSAGYVDTPALCGLQ